MTTKYCKEKCPANNNGICGYGDYIKGICEAEIEYWNYMSKEKV